MRGLMRHSLCLQQNAVRRWSARQHHARSKLGVDDLYEIAIVSGAVCGMIVGAANDKNDRMGGAFWGGVGGLVLGIISPIIVPCAIVSAPFYLKDYLSQKQS